ncbi:MAG: response regulator [Acidobacteriota bacterium]
MSSAEASSTSGDGPTRVLLVDDHTLFREGVARLLAEDGAITVVGEAATSEAAIESCRDLEPDLVVMDLMMPGTGGIEVTRTLRKAHPDLRILVLSLHRDRAYVARSRQAGANGYLPKDIDLDTLLHALRQVADGEDVFPEDSQDAEEVAGRTGKRPRTHLTPRETEVLSLVAEGLSTRQVADRLGISPRTVEAHRRVITQKVGEKKLANLVRYAIRQGLVSP